MTKEEEFEKLLIEYGNSEFDCGGYDGESNLSYTEYIDKAKTSKEKVLEAFKEAKK